MLYIVSSGIVAPIKKHLIPVLRASGVKKYQGLELEETLPKLKKGDIGILLGGAGLEVLRDAGAVAKNLSITALRGTAIEHNGVTWFVTYHPSIIDMDCSKQVQIQWDMRLIGRYVKTGTLDPVIGEYGYVKNFNKLVKAIKRKYKRLGNPVDVTCDLETIGLNPYNEEGPLGTGVWIESIAFCMKVGTGSVLRFRGHESQPIQPLPWETVTDPDVLEKIKLWEQINWLLTSPMVSIKGANFKYDMRWLIHKWAIECTNQKFDTTIVGSLLDENRSNSLEMHTKIYTDMGGYDSTMNTQYDKGRMDLVPDDDFLTYAAGDVDACLQVFHCMKKELLDDPYLPRFYVRSLHRSSHTFGELERVGVLIDTKIQSALEIQLNKERAELEAGMQGMMSVKFRLKHAENMSIRAAVLSDYYFGVRGLKLKPKMETPKTKKPSTAMEHFEMFEDEPKAADFTKKLKAFNSAGKTLQTYVVGFNKHLQSDNRFHASYMLHKGGYESSTKGKDSDTAGTDTGRTSAKDPAVQTIPKHTIWAKPLRKAYIAPPGKVILSCDYAAGELRVAADIANEMSMINAFNHGVDIHSKTAAGLVGMELEEFMLLHEGTDKQKSFFKRNRQGAKAGNFGLLYGMSAGGSQAYAASSYGLNLTLAEAEANRAAFFAMYPALTAWHKAYKARARRDGQIRSPLGRIRHLPMINSRDGATRSKQERNSINSPVQGTLSDLTQFSLIELQAEYGFKELEPMMMVHDDLKFYVPEKSAEVWAERVCHTMSHLPLHEFDWYPKLTFAADAELGYNLAEMEEVKFG